MRVAQHSADQLRLDRWAYSPCRRSQQLVISTCTARRQTFALKTGGEPQVLQNAVCCFPAAKADFYLHPLGFKEKEVLVGGRQGSALVFVAFGISSSTSKVFASTKPVSGVSVSSFWVCLSNVHVVARLLD